MTDWYSWAFGRPNPGVAANSTPVSRYLDNPEASPNVARQSAFAAERARAARVAAGRDGQVTNAPAPVVVPAARPTRGITGGDVVRAARDVAGYVGDAMADGVPHNSYDPNAAAAAPAPTQPTLDNPSTISPGEGTPLSALTGDRPQPYGSDFAAWYEATHSHPLPSVLRAPEVSAEAPAPAQPGPESIGPTSDFTADFTQAERDAFDAEHQAFLRQRDGRPTDFDLTYMAIMAPRGPRTTQTYEEWRAAHQAKPDGAKQLMNHDQVARDIQDRNRQQTDVNDQRTEYRDPLTGEVTMETREDRRRREQQQREDEHRIEQEQGWHVSRRRIEYRRRF